MRETPKQQRRNCEKKENAAAVATDHLTLISLLYSGDSDGSHSLLVDELAETCLALDDAIGHIAPDAHKQLHATGYGTMSNCVSLAAKGGQPHNKLDGVNIVSNDDLVEG